MIGLRLHEAPYTGDIRENKPKRLNPLLFVAPGCFHPDSCEDFALHKPATFSGGKLSLKVSNLSFVWLRCFHGTVAGHVG